MTAPRVACRMAVVILHPHLLEIIPLSATYRGVNGWFPAESPATSLRLLREGQRAAGRSPRGLTPAGRQPGRGSRGSPAPALRLVRRRRTR
jgi:hypothetical protein